MAVYQSIIYSRQERFQVEDDMRCELFEMEKGMSAVEIAKRLCGRYTSLIGEFVISDTGRQEIVSAAKPLFEKLCQDRFLDHNDKNLLVLACVLLVRNSVAKEEGTGDRDRAERGQVWPIIFEGLDHRRILEKTRCNEQRAANLLKKVMHERIRFFAKGGQEYFNTLRLHALAPDGSIWKLYDDLYNFYHIELGCRYDPNGDAASVFVSRKKQRWSGEDRSGSGGIAVGQQKLFLLRPNYMTAVCDALLEKIDHIAQCDLSNLSELNRWDVLLKSWYERKSEEDRRQMTSDRRYARRSNYKDRKGKISPVYEMEDGQPCLVIPGFRHPMIDRIPLVQLYQNNKVCFEREMRISGVPGDYLTHPMVIPLREVINWRRKLNMELRITVGSPEIYRSNGDLLREYLCFAEDGRETRLVRRDKPMMLITMKIQGMKVDGAGMPVHDTGGPYRLTEICTKDLRAVLLNGKNILEEPAAIRENPKAYMMPDANPAVEAEEDGTALSVHDSQPTLYVPLATRDEGKNYRLIINEKDYSLYGFQWDGARFCVDLPGKNGYVYHVQVRDLDRGRTKFRCDYTVLPGFAYSFDRPFYMEEGEEGVLTVTVAGQKQTCPFRLAPDMDSVSWRIGGAEFRVRVPRLIVRLDDQDAFQLPEHIWHKKLLDSTLTIQTPDDVTCTVVVPGKYMEEISSIPMQFLLARCSGEKEVTLGLVIRWKGQVMKKKPLIQIYFRPVMMSDPVVQDGRRIRWELHKEDFIGDDDAAFEVRMENDEGNEPWIMTPYRNSYELQSDFPCRPGDYGYSVRLVEQMTVEKDGKVMKKIIRTTLKKGKIRIEESPEDEFRDCYLLLDRVKYDHPVTNRTLWTDMKNPRIKYKIDKIQYNREKACFEGKLIPGKPGDWQEENQTEDDKVYMVMKPNQKLVVYKDKNLDETIELDLSEVRYDKGSRRWFGVKIYLDGELEPQYWACSNCFHYQVRRAAD